MSDLSVVILCGRSPRHLYLANRLCRAGRPLAIVQENGVALAPARLTRFLHPVRLWRKLVRRLRTARLDLAGREAAFFFPQSVPALDRHDLLHEVAHINHPRVLALLERLQPDVIAVFGTSLIRGAVLGSGRLGLFNLHGGLSPEYRGADCTFWALYNGEPEKIGCTLHRIDAGIDTGTLIAHVCPEVREGDDEPTLFWRAVRDGAEAFAQLLERLERGERLGQPQPHKGRLYQVKDRTPATERALEERLRQGALRGVRLPRRVRWYAADQTIHAAFMHQD
jgi:hypothetical protein